jgi:hypothetical protein
MYTEIALKITIHSIILAPCVPRHIGHQRILVDSLHEMPDSIGNNKLEHNKTKKKTAENNIISPERHLSLRK